MQHTLKTVIHYLSFAMLLLTLLALVRIIST